MAEIVPRPADGIPRRGDRRNDHGRFPGPLAGELHCYIKPLLDFVLAPTVEGDIKIAGRMEPLIEEPVQFATG